MARFLGPPTPAHPHQWWHWNGYRRRHLTDKDVDQIHGQFNHHWDVEQQARADQMKRYWSGNPSPPVQQGHVESTPAPVFPSPTTSVPGMPSQPAIPAIGHTLPPIYRDPGDHHMYPYDPPPHMPPGKGLGPPPQ